MISQTLYVVDDDQSFVDSIGFMLEGAGYTLSLHTDPIKAIETVCEISIVEPACLLLDVRMPQMSGLEFHEHLRARGLDLPIIYLTGHADVALAVEAMAKGAYTFIEKPVDANQLEDALKAAFSPDVQCRRQSAQDLLMASERAVAINSLTTREAEVLNAIMQGDSARLIGERLFISAKTVDFHRARIMSKLKVRSVGELRKAVALHSLSKNMPIDPHSTALPKSSAR